MKEVTQHTLVKNKLPQIKALIDSNKHVSLDHIGFPTDWENFLKK